MIITIVGKPGGGKTLYAVRHVVKVLTQTQNSVVTNLSLILPELSAYLAKHFPHLDIDVNRRIRIIDEKQSRRFWLYRIHRDGMHLDLASVTRDEEKLGINVDYSSVVTIGNRAAFDAGLPRPYPGICYIIDECHVFFDSRAWAESGLSLTFYNSQHRKLDDDVLFITQFLELIDKRVKGFSQEFIYLRNNGAEKILTLFRGPAYFSARHYQKPASGLSDFPSETHRFGLDLELCKCYDTSAGVGISGVGKPETKKKSGLSLWWALVPIFAACYLLWAAPDWLAKAAVGTDVGGRSAQTLGLIPSSNPAQAASLPSGPSRTPQRVAVANDSSAQILPPYPTGYVLSARKITVQMSDGTTRIEARGRRGVGEILRIERNAVWIDGEKQFFRAAPRPVSAVDSAGIIAPSAVLPALTDSSAAPESDVAQANEWTGSTGPLGLPSGRIGR